MYLKNKRIFVIEDDAANLAVISVMLRQAGAVVQFDRWGVDSLVGLKNFMPVDLILLDLMLPHNISGFEVFDKIRERPEFAAVPVVAVTAADPDTELEKARARGFNGYIAKPIRMATFALHLSEILRGEKLWLPG